MTREKGESRRERRHLSLESDDASFIRPYDHLLISIPQRVMREKNPGLRPL